MRPSVYRNLQRKTLKTKKKHKRKQNGSPGSLEEQGVRKEDRNRQEGTMIVREKMEGR